MANQLVFPLADAVGLAPERVGGKAANLAELAAAGFAVPPGFVIAADALDRSDGDLRGRIEDAIAEVATTAAASWPRWTAGPYAVRSSADAEDLGDASYAGVYRTVLQVPRDGLVAAVRRCHAAATSTRVAAYQARRPAGDVGTPAMSVLVQPMVPAEAAGVAFTANPLTGDRDETVVTAVRGLGERLVGGEAVGDEWIVRGHRLERRRAAENAIGDDQVRAVARLAGRVHDHFGVPQDVEWAIAGGRLWLLQARPMTALPARPDWTPPGPGLWTRNFRLGEWLPDPVTPLFADWLLPGIEAGYLAGMASTVGTAVPFRYAIVNGWYYNAPPVPSPRLLAAALAQSRGRVVPVLYNALVRVWRDPPAADRAVLGRLYRQWRDRQLPGYRRMVAATEAAADHATAARSVEIVDELSRAAGEYLWFLAVVGGSAWKMERRLSRFCREHLDHVLHGDIQVLLRGLPVTEPATPPHAVYSVDWYHPTIGELRSPGGPVGGESSRRHRELARERGAAEAACRAALRTRSLRARFDALLGVAQRYAVIREEQAREFTLAWPVLRRCARRLGERLRSRGVIDDAEDVFFLTRSELHATSRHASTAAGRRAEWRRQARLPAPLTLGKPPRLIGDPIARSVEAARGAAAAPDDAIVGHPASAGRATGRVRLIGGPEEFDGFAAGEVLLTRVTAPAWTPLFARAAAVVTDGGTLAAHASLVAREYGIPAVVGTGDATTRLRTGQVVTVDGTAGMVTTVSTGSVPVPGTDAASAWRLE